MATTPASASLRYWPGPVSGQARSGYYNGSPYSGTMTFDFSSIGDLTNIDISSIKLSFTVGALGGAYTKYLYLRHSSRNGTVVGNYSFTGCYNTNKSITFSASNNSGGFNILKAYIEGLTTPTVVLGTASPSTSRGSASGKSYDYDYMNITAATLELTYTYKKSAGVVTGANTGSSSSLKITAYNSAYGHKITWKLGSYSAVQSGASYTGQTSYTVPYTIPHSWLPNATSGTVTVTLETFDANNNSLGTNTYTFTTKVPTSVLPTIGNLTTAHVNDGQNTNLGVYIQGKSKCTLTVASLAAGSGASSLSSYTITTNPSYGNVSKTGLSGTSLSNQVLTTNNLSAAGTVTFTVTVTDSRGRSASKTTTINVQAYSPPQVTALVQAYRCDSGGTKQLTTGTYCRIQLQYSYTTFTGGTANALVTQKVEVGSTTNGAISNNTLTGALGGGALNVNLSYNAKVTLVDKVGGTTTYYVTIPSAAYIMHVRKGGRSMGIGQAAPSANDTLGIGWNVELAHPLSVASGGIGANNGMDAFWNIQRACYMMDNNSDWASYAWHKIADITITGASNDRCITFLVTDNFNIRYGILRCRVRTNSSRVLDTSSALQWLACPTGFDLNNFVVRYTNVANTSCTAEIWVKTPGQYTQLSFTVLQESDRSANLNRSFWTLYNSNGHGSAAYTTGTGGFVSTVEPIWYTGDWSGNAIPVAKGGTGATAALGARTNLQAALGKYTTGEVNTGCTYTDGKTIYRYVCAGSTSGTGDITTDFTLPRTPAIVFNISGSFYRSSDSTWRPIPFVTYYNINQSFSAVVVSNVIHLYVGTGMTGTKNWYLVVEYSA